MAQAKMLSAVVLTLGDMENKGFKTVLGKVDESAGTVQLWIEECYATSVRTYNVDAATLSVEFAGGSGDDCALGGPSPPPFKNNFRRGVVCAVSTHIHTTSLLVYR